MTDQNTTSMSQPTGFTRLAHPDIVDLYAKGVRVDDLSLCRRYITPDGSIDLTVRVP